LDGGRIAAAASHVAEADAALNQIADAAWLRRSEDAAEVAFNVEALPREIRRRLARLAIRRVQPDGGSDNIEALLDSLQAGKTATHGDVVASAKGEIWRFAPAPPRRSH
jgi:tRNA(Ile)-lysidine synthase